MRRLAVKAVAIVLGAVGSARSQPVVHYTFDSDDIVGPTAVDVAGGDNNLRLFNAVGTGVAGVLGEAIRLPDDDGVSYGRLIAADNPAPNGSAERTFAYWFSQEAVGVENKMFGYGRANPGQSFDVSLEGGGVRLRYSGGNVTWGQGLFDFVGADAGFHHLAIRVPPAANDYLDVDVFLDGAELLGTPTAGSPGTTAINTGGGAATNLDIGRSPAFLPSGDYIGLIDDFRIYDYALSDAEILDLAGGRESLVLEVNDVTGMAAITNPTDAPVPLSYYEIEGADIALLESSWLPLESQDRADFPAGDGSGDGWEALGAAPDRVAEGRLVGSSVLAPGGWVGLGELYNAAAGEVLSLLYRSDGEFRTGLVSHVSDSTVGDYNRDGVVDTADYTVWRDNEGGSVVLPSDATPGVVDASDFGAWSANYGESSGAVGVPEPSALALLAPPAAGWLRRGERNRSRPE